MKKIDIENCEILKKKLLNWSSYAKEILSKEDMELTIENEIKNKLVIPLIKDIFFFIYEDEYKMPEKFRDGGNKYPDICIENIKNEICYLVEVKKYLYSRSSTKMPLCNKARLKQIRDYFSNCKVKPFFIILTNGFHYLFFSNFTNQNQLDQDSFFKISLLDDNIDYLKLFRLLKIPFYTRSNSIKVQIRSIFYMDTNNLQLKLKSVREEKCLSQMEIALKLNCSQQRVNAIERNKCGITLRLICQICEILDCSIYDLTSEYDRKEKDLNYYLYLLSELKKNAPTNYIKEYLEDIESEFLEIGPCK